MKSFQRTLQQFFPGPADEMTSGRLTDADWLELGVTFRVVDEELAGPVIEHLRTSFLPDEPVSRSVSWKY